MLHFMILMSACIAAAEDDRTEANPTQFPFIVSIRHFKEHLCGGTILNKRWILTNAYRYPEDLSIAVGAVSWWFPEAEYEVAETIPHPRFIVEDRVHDIGLVKSKKPMAFNDKVAPASLPTQGNVGIGVTFKFPSWIYKEETGRYHLRYYMGQVMDKARCKRVMEAENVPVGDDDICGRNKREEFNIVTERGSPMMHGTGNVVHGVAARGIALDAEKLVVFTAVYPYLDWIKKTISN